MRIIIKEIPAPWVKVGQFVETSRGNYLEVKRVSPNEDRVSFILEDYSELVVGRGLTIATLTVEDN